MEYVTVLEDLQTESSCPICLDYLQGSVALKYRHNFCLFLHPTLERKFRRNHQLANLPEIVKQVQIRRSKRKRKEETLVCEKHNQVLRVFCQNDLKALCLQCSFSIDYQNHYGPSRKLPRITGKY
ncbi:PREDICTED: tripartite motif-containing protein 60-like [Chrysochloris asiatica]|uniref:Tripartite motif-containing protein 60-like n=1 Tax=Chrysochloris asiatica TaxID=185453 RepID=A0A9B0WZ43_CHRAS|nr:PREDICTED: tripartite motif-containing protein 60-like [Chrysochloris asiatica]